MTGALAVVAWNAVFECRAQTPVWAESLGGAASDSGDAVAVDVGGNVISVGRFSGTVDFDPSNTVYNLTSVGSSDIYVSKLSSSGAFIWARRIGGTSFEFPTKVAVDAAGNSYAVGYFTGTVDFDPGAQVKNLIASGAEDAFILKLDSGGEYVWATALGGASTDTARDVAIDSGGNLITVGRFAGTVDFDPGPDVVYLTGPGSAFVWKLDADGNFRWAVPLVATVFANGVAVTVDGGDNVFAVGSFAGTADFDPGAGTQNLAADTNKVDVFIWKLDESGGLGWVRRFRPLFYELDASGATTDSSGNVFIAGRFFGAVNFGASTLDAGLTWDAFLSKFDSSGVNLWTRQLGGTANAYCDGGIVADGSGNIYSAGDFGGGGGGPGSGSGLGPQEFLRLDRVPLKARYEWAIRVGRPAAGNGDEPCC